MLHAELARTIDGAFERRDGIGHQLLLDADLALTGTERAHVQFRPLGGKNSGGSFYNFADPVGYVDNSEIAPQRWWIEGELQSIFGGLIDDPTQQWDVYFTLGKFPLALQNFLLMNDEATGILLGKNTLIIPPFSNINLQAFYLFDDVDAFSPGSTDILGIFAALLVLGAVAVVFDALAALLFGHLAGWSVAARTSGG